MENKKTGSFIFIIIAVILGATLFKQFDFESLRFEKPWLALIYMVVFLLSIYFIVKNSKK